MAPAAVTVCGEKVTGRPHGDDGGQSPMLHGHTDVQTRSMGARDHRKRRGSSLRAAALALACVASVTALGPASAAQDQTQRAADDGIESSPVSVTAVDFEPKNVSRLLGGQVRGVVSVVLTNTTDVDAQDVAARVDIDDRTLFTPAVRVPANETIRVEVAASLGGMSFRERDIVATLGQSEATTTHRVVPWLLVALVGLATNVALVTGRDRLRLAVARRQ